MRPPSCFPCSPLSFCLLSLACLLAGGCMTVRSLSQRPVDLDAIEQLKRDAATVRGPASVLSPRGIDAESAEGTAQGGVDVSSFQQDDSMLPQPIRLAFLATDLATILHSVGHDLPLSFVYPADFGELPLSCDLLIYTYNDLDDFLAVLARFGGLSLRRVGVVYYFEPGGQVTQAESHVEDDTGDSRAGFSGRDWLLFSPPPSSASSLLSLSHAFPSVSCSVLLGLHLCTGDFVHLREYRAAVRAFPSELPLLTRFVSPPEGFELSALLSSLSLTDSVAAFPVEAGALLLSHSAATLSLVADVVSAASEGGRCSVVQYVPEYRSVLDLAESVSALSPDLFCGQPVPSSSALLLRVRDASAVAARLRALDYAARPLRLRVLIVESDLSASAGVSLPSINLLNLPAYSVSDLLELVGDTSLSGAFGAGSAARVVDLSLTDSVVSWSNTSSDRVEGQTTATEGALVRSITTRSVGLTVRLDAERIASGVVGQLSVSDSVLDQDKTLSVSCESDLLVRVGEVAEVCLSYLRRRLGDMTFSGLTASASRSVYRVFAWIVDDYRLPAVEVEQIAIGGSS